MVAATSGKFRSKVPKPRNKIRIIVVFIEVWTFMTDSFLVLINIKNFTQ